ncbi:RNA-binding protein, partial [Nanoarchaeota archaeon]
MNTSLKNFILDLAKKGMRIDERGLNELREVKVSCGVSKNAEGSARVKLGKTEVMVGVKMDVGEPFADRPDEGILIVNAELSALASPEFEPGPPGEEAIELARVVDRGIRGANMIDLKKLFIEEGKVWCVFVDIYVINHDGNLIDAAALGAVAALKDARFPKLEEGKVVYGEKTKKKLPIT